VFGGTTATRAVYPGMSADSTDCTFEGADGVSLHGVRCGESGPLVLFLHGFPETSQAWHRQLPIFGRNHRAVAVDLRGYSVSGRPLPVKSYALPRLVEDIRHVLHVASEGQKAIVVGHDWGGVIAWVLACESPELLEKVAIINAPHPERFLEVMKRCPAQWLSSAYAAFFQIPGLSEIALKAFNCAALRAMLLGASAKPEMFPDKLRAAYLESWKLPGALTAMLNYYRNPAAAVRLVKEKPSWRIEIPTLLLWGEKDPALRLSNLRGLEALVPRLTILRHPRATHWIVHEEPQWVNTHLHSFLGGR
jgi:epoxide hydrolase 4